MRRLPAPCARASRASRPTTAPAPWSSPGGGEAFCAGADLKALDLDPEDPAGPMGFSRLAASKPTIAAIDGWCLAGGVQLALWCDLRGAAPAPTFGCFERRWG